MKILALDFGSHAIKAVNLDVTFGRIELADYFIERVTEPAPEVKSATSGDSDSEAEKEGEEKKKKAPPPRV